MRRFMTATTVALLISGAATFAQTRIQDVSTTGCIRLWKPAPTDPTKMPDDRQPGLAGIYLLTPLSSNPAAPADLPTYVLTPSSTLNYAQHVGHKVEVVGAAQAAPSLPAPQDLANAQPRPENKSTTDSMPRLTVTTLKMVTESCP